MRTLPTQFIAPAFVGTLRDGRSFGRHCCVIGPAGKAIRETGFNLDGQLLWEPKPVSRLRPLYWRKRWEGDVTSRPWLPPKQHVSGRVAVLNTRASHNFYHWMVDVLPRLAALRRVGAEADYYLIDCLAPFQQQVMATLGIEPHQLIQPHCRLLLEADELLVPSLPTPQDIREFGQILAHDLGVHRPIAASRRIYISRRNANTRTIANEDELERILDDYGFENHRMEEYPLSQQAQLVREADTIFALHGAGLANLIFARPGTRVIEIVPTGRYNATLYPEKSRILGLHHQLLFADRVGQKQNLHVSLDDVETALSRGAERLIRAAA